jgi:membrane associated rhomboid family serine protease
MTSQPPEMPEPAPTDSPRDPSFNSSGDSGRRREPVFNLAGVVVFAIALCALIHLVRAEFLTAEQDFALVLRFAFIPIRYTGGFSLDVWAFVSPISYSLLHGGLAHLLVNCVWLAAFGSPLANRIGATRFLLFWAATALGAVALHFALYPHSTTPLIGASGAISGMMGAASRFGFRIDRSLRRPAFTGPIMRIAQVFRSRQAVSFLLVWLAINVAVGFGFGAPGDAQVAWEAHIGGLIVGFFAIRFFDRPSGAIPPGETGTLAGESGAEQPRTP